MIRDTFDSIRLALGERIGNPFLATAVFSSAVLNWKLSLLLFSSKEYEAKVSEVSSLYPSADVAIQQLIIGPATVALIWVFLWPLANTVINGYWYFMRSVIANVRLIAERKRRLSEPEAAEIYTAIDSQETKYLDLLRQRQKVIEDLHSEISVLRDEYDGKLENSRRRIEKVSSENVELEKSLKRLEEERDSLGERFNAMDIKLQRAMQSLDEISNKSLQYADFMPGLKAITNAINKLDGYVADEAWVREEFHKQEPSFARDSYQTVLDFLLALGIIKRLDGGKLGFGDRYRHSKDRILGAYNNSPGPRSS